MTVFTLWHSVVGLIAWLCCASFAIWAIMLRLLIVTSICVATRAIATNSSLRFSVNR